MFATQHFILSSSESDDEEDEASKIVSKDLVEAVEDVVGPLLKLKIEDNLGNKVKIKVVKLVLFFTFT